MPATGVSGLDLYVKTADGKWQWVANGRPTAETNTVQLASGLAAGEKEYLLYLPLYNGVSSVEIGLPKGTALKKADAAPGGQGQADRLLRHVDHAGRVRVAAGHGPHRDPRPQARPPGHQPRLLRQRHARRRTSPSCWASSMRPCSCSTACRT